MDKSIYDVIYARAKKVQEFRDGLDQIDYSQLFDIVQKPLFGDLRRLIDGEEDGVFKQETTLFPSEVLRDVEDDKSVTYKWNHLGFRCDEFKTSHDKKHILFMGCSETVGVGGNLDEAWAYILYKKLSEQSDNSGYFNIAVSGSGPMEQIIRYKKYEQEYGKPDEIYMMIPESYRGYLTSSSHHVYWGLPIAETSGVYYNKGTYQSFLFNTLSQMAEFEVYCKDNGIKLAWSVIEDSQSKLFEKLPFKNFVKVIFPEGMFEEREFFSYQGQYKYKDIEKNFLKRDMHWGYVYHQYWADTLFEYMSKNENN